MRRALLALLLVACRNDPPQGSTTSSTASVTASASASVAPQPSAPPVSDWTDANTPQPVELVNAPERTAVVGFDTTKGGYFVARGARTQALPREWFGAGPPRKDLSVSADGIKLGVPDEDAIVIYDTGAKRWLARLTAPEPGLRGALAVDGKSVRWTAPGKPCSMTDIETKAVKKGCS